MRSILVAALFVLGTSACLRASTVDPDASNGNGNNGGGKDASSGGNPDASGNHPDAGNTGGPDASMGNPDAGMTGLPCKAHVGAVGSGHHNQGQDCMNSCHFHGFSLAGTLYSAPSGGSVISGASITVKDASGQTFDIVSQADGNFYTSQSVSFPVTVYASDCSIQQAGVAMSATLSSGSAGCNQSGCHTTSSQGRVHLP